jgi:hypothetical protein
MSSAARAIPEPIVALLRPGASLVHWSATAELPAAGQVIVVGDAVGELRGPALEDLLESLGDDVELLIEVRGDEDDARAEDLEDLIDKLELAVELVPVDADGLVHLAGPLAAVRRARERSAALSAAFVQLEEELDDALLLEREVEMQHEVIRELSGRAERAEREQAHLVAEQVLLVARAQQAEERASVAEAHAAAVEARLVYRVASKLAASMAQLPGARALKAMLGRALRS